MRKRIDGPQRVCRRLNDSVAEERERLAYYARPGEEEEARLLFFLKKRGR